MNAVQNIIKEICEEKNIQYKLVSKDWITILEKEKKRRYIVGYKFPLNDQAVGRICDDKYALYEVIRQFDIPIVEHYIVFKNYNKENIENYCKQYNFNMVIKDNLGTCGKDMYHVMDKTNIFLKLEELLNKNRSVSISPYYEIKNEYRTIILNGEAELVYGKQKPSVIGNGKNTIYELLCEFNKKYFSAVDEDECLRKILKEGEVYEYNWQFNLSKGAMPFFIQDKIKETKVVEMAKCISEVLNVKFASVDIIELNDGTMLLLEVNSGIMMDNITTNLNNGRQIAKSIYSKAIDEMFK